jgi:prepilin peptidase CpaA
MIDLLVYVFPTALIIAAVSDITKFEIPDWISIALVVVYPIVALLGGAAWADIGLHAAAGVLVFIGGAVLFYFRAFGGGDVKLLAASAVWVGWQELLTFILVVALAGGLVTLLLLILRLAYRGVRRISGSSTDFDATSWYTRLLSPERGVPYGVAIGLAGFLVFPKILNQLGVTIGF